MEVDERRNRRVDSMDEFELLETSSVHTSQWSWAGLTLNSQSSQSVSGTIDSTEVELGARTPSSEHSLTADTVDLPMRPEAPGGNEAGPDAVTVEDETRPGSEENNWEICFHISRLFQRRAEPGPWTCTCCGKAGTATKPLFRSVFAQTVSRCPRGCALFPQPKSIICPDCDEDMVQRITERRQQCWINECGRILYVDEKLMEKGAASVELVDGGFERYSTLLTSCRKFECAFCYVDYDLNQGSLQPPTTKCKHDINICNGCFGSYLEAELRSKNCEVIRCPDPACTQLISAKEMKTIAKTLERPGIMSQYEKLLIAAKLSKNPNFRWCNNLEPKCESGQLRATASSDSSTQPPMWTCQKCNVQNCFTHKSLWHHGLTCEDVDSGKTEKDVAEEYLKKISKRCPKRGCEKRIYKDGRCKDMRCKVAAHGCGTEFCWQCKVIYPVAQVRGRGRAQHLSTCRWRCDANTVPKPAADDPLYKPGWDVDPEYVVRADEYTYGGREEDRNL